MKKLTKVSMATALVASALTPVAAFAAEGNAPAGFYNVNTGEVVTPDAFPFLSPAKKLEILMNAKSEVYFLDGSGKALAAGVLLTATTNEQVTAAQENETTVEERHNVEFTTGGKVETPTPAEATVESVKAMNAKQVQITFNKPVKGEDPNGVLNSGKLLNITFTPVGSASPVTSNNADAELSEDGKTLTVTAASGEKFDGKYTVNVPVAVQDTADKAIAAYTNFVTVNDTARPTLKDVTYGYNGTNRTAVLEFSEPVDITSANIKFERTDGVELDGTNTNFENTSIVAVADSNDTKYTIVFDKVANADKNKDIKVTATGIKDYAGNLATPNPLTTIIKVDTTDTVAPKTSSITVKDNKTLTVKFDKALSVKPGDTTFALKNAATPAPGDLASTSVTKVDATTYDVFFTNGLPKGLQTVKVPQVTDTNGNNSAAAGEEKLITINLDEVAPILQSSNVEKINGKEYLVLNYNENVTPENGVVLNLDYTEDYVSKTASITTVTAVGGTQNFTLNKPVNGESKSVKLDLSSLTTSATYTAKLNAGLVEDLNGNASETKTGVAFTRTVNVVSGKPDVSKIDTSAVGGSSITDNSVVKVTFDKKIDPATALNKANYSIEGAQVESIRLTSNGTTAVIELKLAEGSSQFSGDRTVKVSGVKSEAGDVMDTHTEVVDLNENVAPTVSKAAITANDEITLTFSEAVKGAGDLGKDSFVVKSGTSTVAQAGAGATIVSGNSKQVMIKLASPLTTEQLAQTITVESTKTAADFKIMDLKNNKLKAFTPVTVIKP